MNAVSLYRPIFGRNGAISTFLHHLFEAAEDRLKWILSWMLSFVLQWVFKLDEAVEVLTVERFGILVAEGIYIKCKGCPPIIIEKAEVKVEWGIDRPGCVISTAIVTNARFKWTDFVNSASEIESVLSFNLEYPLFLTLKEKLLSFRSFTRSRENLQPLNCIPLTLHWLKARDVRASHRTIHQNNEVSYVSGVAELIDVVFLAKEEKLLQIVAASNGLEFSCKNEDSIMKFVSLPDVEFQADFADPGPVKLNLFIGNSFVKLIPFTVNTVILLADPFLTLLTQEHDDTDPSIVGNNEEFTDKRQLQFQIKTQDLSAHVGVEDTDCFVLGKCSFTGQTTQWTNKVDLGAVMMLQLYVKDALTQKWNKVLGSADQHDTCDNEPVLIALSVFYNKQERDVSYSLQINDPLKISLSPATVTDLSYLLQIWMKSLDNSSGVDIPGIIKRLDDNVSSSLRNRKFYIEVPELVLLLNDRASEEVITTVVTGQKINICISKQEEFYELKIKDIMIDNCKNGVPLFYQTQDKQKNQPILQLAVKKLRETTDNKAVFKVVDIEPGNVTIQVKEYELLRILQFAHNVKDSGFWSFGSAGSSVTGSTAQTRLQLSKCEFHSFQAVVCMEPTTNLPDELRLLKISLSLPPQFPPKIDETVLEFGPFIRTEVQYRSALSFATDVKKYYFKELGVQSTKVVGAFHLLGNLSQLKRQVKTSLSQLKETGDVKSFVSDLSQGVADSYLKIRGSWSEYLTASAAQTSSNSSKTDEVDGHMNSFSPLSPRRMVSRVRGLIGSLATPNTLLFPSVPHPLPVNNSISLPDISSVHIPGTASASVASHSAVASPINIPQDTSMRTRRSLPCLLNESNEMEAHSLVFENNNMEDDSSEGYATPEESMSAFLNTSQPVVALWEPRLNQRSTTPGRPRSSSGRECLQLPKNKKLLPDSYIKHAKGQEFLRRLKVELADEETEEKFICCMNLRSSSPSDKLRAVVSSQKVYFMKDGLPSAKSVVLMVDYCNLLNAQYLQTDSSHFVELVMRALGTTRLSLASRNPADCPLVRCDTMTIARKAVSKINEAKKNFS